ncbi:MAG: hypothetical protein HUJ18_09930 [Marinobacter sp.]|nr:hypothetical protein [Marinobacter sp.]
MSTGKIDPQFDPRRFVKTPVGWYALTREPYDLGPFPTKPEAFTALNAHIRLHAGLNRRNPDDRFTGFSVHDAGTCAKNNCGRCAEALEFPVVPAIA